MVGRFRSAIQARRRSTGRGTSRPPCRRAGRCTGSSRPRRRSVEAARAGVPRLAVLAWDRERGRVVRVLIARDKYAVERRDVFVPPFNDGHGSFLWVLCVAVHEVEERLDVSAGRVGDGKRERHGRLLDLALAQLGYVGVGLANGTREGGLRQARIAQDPSEGFSVCHGPPSPSC